MNITDSELLHQLVKDVETIKGQNQNIMSIIGGDMTGRVGLIQTQNRVCTDLYDQKNGLMIRVSAIETDRAEKKAEFRGGKTVLSIGAMGIGFLIGKAFDWAINKLH